MSRSAGSLVSLAMARSSPYFSKTLLHADKVIRMLVVQSSRLARLW
jgi:hypothetical protein